MDITYLKKKISLLFILLGLSLQTMAQVTAANTNSQLVIKVINAATKRPVNDANVSIQSQVDGATFNGVVTNGEYVISLPRGQYAATVVHPNFKATQLPRLVIESNRVNTFTIEMLAAGSDVEVIQVFADQSRVQNSGSAGTRYLDRELLRSATGSGGDILRALDGLAGLFSRGEFASFTVRGNGPRDNLIFVDGFPFQKIVHFADGFGEQEAIEGGGRYSIFAPNIINGAEFQPGGWSAAYGGKAGSLLKLSVASGNSEQSTYTGLFDFAGFEAGYEGPNPLTQDGTMLLSLRQQDFGRLFDIIGIEDIGSPKNTDLIFKTSTSLNADTDLETLLIYATEKNTRDLTNALASDEDDPGNYEDLELSNSEADNLLLGLTLSRFVGESGVWDNRLYYRLYDEDGTFGEAYPDLVPEDTPMEAIPIREGILTSASKETEFGLRSDFSYLNDFGQMSAGLRLAYLDLDYSLSLQNNWIRFQYDTKDAPADPTQRYVVLTPDLIDTAYQDSALLSSAYIEQNFDFNAFSYRAGLRVENDGFADKTEILPRFGVNWTLSSRINLAATVGRYTQSLRFSDRASDPGNSNLQNERVDSFSVGVTYQINNNWQFLLEPYYQRLSNLLVETDGLANAFSNAGEGKSFGFDTGLFKRFDNSWSLDIQYSYNQSEVKDGPQQTYYDSDFNRPHFFSVGGLWDINESWSVSARFKFASGTPTDDFIVHADVLGETPVFENYRGLRFSKENISTNTQRFENFNSLNFRVDYRTEYKRTAINIFLDVINAYGADNPSSTEFNERTGQDVIEEGEVFPFLGIRVTL
ncbi:TonB-dependent receptor [Alteromonas sediminis]|uniref:TonB-dependent receptor n=1 Tax=Alteromonas sediminis TaxID=2259342 RepID=A0A3N5Y0I5_9ALTE|nr:TonB-dependent receptor [Alteromonas sediminis]RPJ66962.1 TonB-dependent receptor [Alteromonas sediminis]